MRKVKLTITESACRGGHHRTGDSFLVEDLCPPLCHELWNGIYPYVFALLNGAELDRGPARSRTFDAKCPDGGRVRVHGELLETGRETTEATIQTIQNPEEKQRMARAILEALPEWFGIPEARENYIRESAGQIMLGATENGVMKGFLCLKETGKDTLEIAVMGVRKEYHRQGVGAALVEAAKQRAREMGYSFLQVKTVRMGRYPEYDATNRFYLHCGFQEFEVFPTLWDEWNPCQIYVMALWQ